MSPSLLQFLTIWYLWTLNRDLIRSEEIFIITNYLYDVNAFTLLEFLTLVPPFNGVNSQK